jgi:hypothetical protein
MIEAGKVTGKARNWGLGRAKTGSEQIGIEFEILSGPDAGKSITAYLYFTEKTFDRTVESLRHCGWQGDDLASITGLDANEVQLVIDHEQDNTGELRARVKWINALGGLAMNEVLSPNEAKEFAARMRARVASIGKKAAATKPAQGASRPPQGRREEPPPHTDRDAGPSSEDIPF